MKLFIGTFLCLLATSFAAPQSLDSLSLNGLTGLFNSTSNFFGSLLPGKANGLLPSASSPMGCSQFFSGLKEGKIEAIPVENGKVRKYAICFEPIVGTCGVKFDLSQLQVAPAPALARAPAPFPSPAPAPAPFLPPVRMPEQEMVKPVPVSPMPLPSPPTPAPIAPAAPAFDFEPVMPQALARARRSVHSDKPCKSKSDEELATEAALADEAIEQSTQVPMDTATEASMSETSAHEDKVTPVVSVNTTLTELQELLLKETIERLKTMEQAFMKSKAMLMKRLSEALPLPSLLVRKSRQAPVLEQSLPVPVPSALPEAPLVPATSSPLSPSSDLCHNFLFFPPTSDSFGGKVVCLDRVSEPSVMLVGTPLVVYVTASESKAFTIPFAYQTSC